MYQYSNHSSFLHALLGQSTPLFEYHISQILEKMFSSHSHREGGGAEQHWPI